jgi:hypothetical protein
MGLVNTEHSGPVAAGGYSFRRFFRYWR